MENESPFAYKAARQVQGAVEALNLCLYVSFLTLTGSLGSARGRLGAASRVLHDDVTSHAHGRNQQPHERDE